MKSKKPIYPLADKDSDGWYSDGNYEQRGGVLLSISPKDYLQRVRPLVIDEVSRENIDILKDHILKQKPLDPLKIYSNGKEDGRHRAHACVELGISKVPVVIFS